MPWLVALAVVLTVVSSASNTPPAKVFVVSAALGPLIVPPAVTASETNFWLAGEGEPRKNEALITPTERLIVSSSSPSGNAVKIAFATGLLLYFLPRALAGLMVF